MVIALEFRARHGRRRAGNPSTMSAVRQKASRSTGRRQQLENVVVDSLSRTQRADRLNADMVSTSVPMLADSGSDRALVAPRHHRVEKALRAAAREIILPETLAPPAVDVILELQIPRECFACGATRSRRVGLQQDPKFRAQQLSGPEDRTRLCGMIWRRVVRVRAIGKFGR